MILTDDQINLSALVDAVYAGGQFTLVTAQLRRLPEFWIESAGLVGGTSRRVDRALVELRAVRRIGEPVAAIRMRHNIVRRIETLAVELRRNDCHGAVQLVAHDTARDVLAGKLASLEIERIAVAVV